MQYVYAGSEVMVGEFKLFVITSLSIDILNVEEGRAVGSIKTMDHFENFPNEYSWEARKIENRWEIWCTSKSYAKSRVEEDGSIGFTWQPSINEDIKKFVLSQLILCEEQSSSE